MKLLWPVLLAICTASLCLGILEAALDVRGASPFVRPYHYGGTLLTAFAATGVFWPLYRCIEWLRRQGAFLLSMLFLLVLLSAWAVTLPLGDRIAVHYQRLDDPKEFMIANGPPGYGWFYWDDSGMGDDPMDILHIPLALSRAWLLTLFLLFFPCFFCLHRNSETTGSD